MTKADSVHSTPPLNASANIIDLAARRARRALPADNVQLIDFPVTARQRASRSRNFLRHPCNRVSLAVTIAGRLQRGEPLGYPVDGTAALREGAAMARQLAVDLEIIAEEHGREAQQ
ncbi:hypothetical protein [Bradyrhizobium sp. 187]|uniref:hypothetical protein n=1 Tax=Bradyrhizobium sp. 187 TaxID=2782655 RepID=UPI001FFF9182|nr:hypothetical protein [Bradyrhizobium sp. 187]UPJ69876.1 hypothetical protein IVB19_19250 [Bradyrhizobium sp. 187]